MGSRLRRALPCCQTLPRPLAAAVAGVDGALDRRRVVRHAVALCTIVLGVSVDDPALPVRDGRADSVMLDFLVPICGCIGIALIVHLCVRNGVQRGGGDETEEE